MGKIHANHYLGDFSKIIPTRPWFWGPLPRYLKKTYPGVWPLRLFWGGFPKSGSCTIYPSVKRKALQQKLVFFRLQLERRISEPSTISFQLSRVVIHGSLGTCTKSVTVDPSQLEFPSQRALAAPDSLQRDSVLLDLVKGSHQQHLPPEKSSKKKSCLGFQLDLVISSCATQPTENFEIAEKFFQCIRTTVTLQTNKKLHVFDSAHLKHRS